jgi:O-antigen/teichoic acid export membrane protein
MLVLSLGVTIALAHVLAPAARGQLAVLQALAGIIAVCANLGVAKAVVHHASKGLISRRAAVAGATILALASAGGAGVVILGGASLLGGRLLGGLGPALVAAALGLAGLQLVREYVSGVLVAAGRSLTLVWVTAAQPAVTLLVLIALAAVGIGSVAGATVAWSAGLGASAGALLVVAVRGSGGWGPVAWTEVRGLARFGLRSYPALVASFLNLRLDQLLVRVLSSAAVLGWYAVAVGVGELLIRVPQIMLWAFSGEIGSRDRAASRELTAAFCRWTVLLVGGAALVTALIAPAVVPAVFGARYRPAVAAVLLLLPGMVCYAPAVIIAEYFIVQRGRPAVAAAIASTSLTVSVLLNLPLTPRLGAAGAALASSASYAAMLVVAVAFFSREGPGGRADLLPRRADVSDLVAALRGAAGRPGSHRAEQP